MAHRLCRSDVQRRRQRRDASSSRVVCVTSLFSLSSSSSVLALPLLSLVFFCFGFFYAFISLGPVRQTGRLQDSFAVRLRTGFLAGMATLCFHGGGESSTYTTGLASPLQSP